MKCLECNGDGGRHPGPNDNPNDPRPYGPCPHCQGGRLKPNKNTPFLYITADAIGTETGGGSVTWNESEALRKGIEEDTITPARQGPLSANMSAVPMQVWSFPNAPRPWDADEQAHKRLADALDLRPRIAHFYSGTFTKTIEVLKERGCKVVYTAAAHSIDVSREEHVKLGLPFDYPHLNDPDLWARYVRGYLLADVVVCPSTLSKRAMEGYGCKNVVVIPHGVELPAKILPPPSRFAVAYLGQPGPDKGLVYLLEAWKILNYKDAVLTIAGRGTEHLLSLVRQLGGGNIYLRGFVEDAGAVYDNCNLYVQPSASEGFGLEILEAMSHGRPVICSDGAGACDVVGTGSTVPARNAQALATAIDDFRKKLITEKQLGLAARVVAEQYAWEKVRQMYVDLWRSL